MRSNTRAPRVLTNEIGRASCRERVEGEGRAGSSRRRHTRYIGDWSSDVCSSDLYPLGQRDGVGLPSEGGRVGIGISGDQPAGQQGELRIEVVHAGPRLEPADEIEHPGTAGIDERDRKSVV